MLALNQSLNLLWGFDQAISLIQTLRFGSGVAQLVEQSLPILEVCGLNPVIGKNLFIY